jgi:hypothetical protein
MLRCVALDVVPSLVFAVGALTLLVPFAIARARHAFVGGLLWPFVADLSRGTACWLLLSPPHPSP